MGVAAGDGVVVVIAKMQISRHEPRGYSKRAQCRDHEHCKVATTPAPEFQGLDRTLAHILVALLKREKGLVVGDNEPYSVTDASDYTIPVHGEQRGLHHVAIEVRQDLIADNVGQRAWAVLLARVLPQAYRELVGAEALRSAQQKSCAG
jgi:N-formylglutamate amidohydrolase